MADGSVIIEAKMDTSKADKELAKLKKEIASTESAIGEQEAKKSPLTAQAEKLSQEMREARAEVQKFGQQWAAGVAGADGQQAKAQERLNQIQNEYAGVVAQIDKVDAKLLPAYEKLDRMKEEAGELQKNINKAANNTKKMEKASQKAEKRMGLFAKRLRGILMSAFVFNILSAGFRELTEWTAKVIKSNDEARAAIARLKGALLTLVQPLLDVVVPAFATLINILADLTAKIAQFTATLFGRTVKDASESAEALYEEQQALEGVGTAAKKAEGQLASFDEINKISSGNANESAGAVSDTIQPDFSDVGDTGWLEETLGEAAGNVTTALILGGVALVAIGAALRNVGMIIAGLGFLGAGIVVGVESGTFGSWIEALGLDSVFDYVTVAMQLAGIALIAVGACMGNIVMVIAGGVILGLGVAADAIGEETLQDWWEVLKLTTIQEWVGVALLLVGIALIAIGACMGNIVMILAGAVCLGIGTITSAAEGNLKDWVKVMGLEKVAGWVTAALLLIGIALVVFGILTGNIMMILVGAGMLGAGIAIGITSGTFAGWLDTISKAFSGFKEKVLNIFSQLWGGMKSFINSILGGVEWMANKVINGINFVIDAINRVHFDIPDWLGGGSFGFNIRRLNTVSIPRLAEGAVIPPNREFMAILGDQKSGTNIEAPADLIRQIVREEAGRSAEEINITVVSQLDGKEVARNTIKHVNDMTRSAGKSLLLV